jgi:hypothetical protein
MSMFENPMFTYNENEGIRNAAFNISYDFLLHIEDRGAVSAIFADRSKAEQLKAKFNHPYWRRASVFPEVAVAQEVLVHGGSFIGLRSLVAVQKKLLEYDKELYRL